MISIPPSLRGKRSASKRIRQMEEKTCPHPHLEQEQIVTLLSRLPRSWLSPSKKWVMHSRQACATHLVLARCCADTDLTEGGQGGRWGKANFGTFTGLALILE